MKSGCGCGVRALDGMTRGPRDGTRGQRRAHFTRGLSARVTCQIVTFACAPTAPTILHLLGLPTCAMLDLRSRVACSPPVCSPRDSPVASLRGSLVAAAKLLTSRAIPYADLRAPAGARGRREGRSAATDT